MKKYIIAFILAIFTVNYAEASTCDEVLSSCEEAVISQEVTIKLCEEASKSKDELIDSVKEQTVATEKSLHNQKVATTTGFSLSTLLLLIILL